MEQKSQNDFVANREHKFVFMNPDAESASMCQFDVISLIDSV